MNWKNRFLEGCRKFWKESLLLWWKTFWGSTVAIFSLLGMSYVLINSTHTIEEAYEIIGMLATVTGSAVFAAAIIVLSGNQMERRITIDPIAVVAGSLCCILSVAMTFLVADLILQYEVCILPENQEISLPATLTVFTSICGLIAGILISIQHALSDTTSD